MSITQQLDNKNKTLLISISGPFSFDQHGAFRDTYRDINGDNNLNITVDLQHSNYLDSAALGMLLLLDEHFKKQRINITNCSTYIMQVFNIVNFEKKFNIS